MEHRSYRTEVGLSPLSDTISVLPLGCGESLTRRCKDINDLGVP